MYDAKQMTYTKQEYDELRIELMATKKTIVTMHGSIRNLGSENRDLCAENILLKKELVEEKRECVEGWRRWRVLLESTK